MNTPRFRTGAVQTIAAIALLALFIHFGNWQAGKAQRGRDMQAQLDARSHDVAMNISSAALDPEADRLRRVAVRGRYVAEYQILLDNQIHAGRAGYHVLTPLRIEGTQDLIYVNRGWVPAAADRATLPAVPPPVGPLEVRGELVAPPKPRWLAHAPPSGASWPALWQAVEVPEIQSRVAERIAPLFVLLDADLPGGYERQWTRPDSRVGMHQSYAYQWYGLAALVLIIYVASGLRRAAKEAAVRQERDSG